MNTPAPALASPGRRMSLPHARVMVAITLLVGAGLLAMALRLRRGSPEFYGVTLLVAAAWALPSLFVRPAPAPARWTIRRELVAGAAVGAAMFGLFVGGAAVGRQFTFLADPIDSILRKADGGPVIAVLAVALVNGVAEELFFRGALVVALGPRSRQTYVVSLLLYVAVTAVGGNTALVLAAVAMGAVWAVERWWTGTLTAPIATHLVWSTLMLLAFPR